MLEDIDSASSDLAAVLVSLIESRSLTVPGFRDRIIPATGFQLFFTRRVVATSSGYYNKQNIATDLLGKHYIQVNIEPLSKEELIEVIEIKVNNKFIVYITINNIFNILLFKCFLVSNIKNNSPKNC